MQARPRLGGGPRGRTPALLLVLLAGGWDGARVTAAAELYDPASGRFTATGLMRTPRSASTATLLPDGKVLVTGGWDGGRFLASAELYDPASGRFAPTAAMHAARFKLTEAVVRLPTGKVRVAGGDPRAEVYDPRRGVFLQSAGGVGAERQFATATALPDGRALILGGYDPDIRPTAAAWVWQPGG